MSTIDLDHPSEESRPYAELYERTKKERDGFARELSLVRIQASAGVSALANENEPCLSG